MPRTSKTATGGRGQRRSPVKLTSGEKTAVAAAIAATPGADRPPTEQIADRLEQLDLIEDVLGLPDLEPGEKVVVLNGGITRNAGRPVGARNKRTQEWADYILSRYTSPLEVLAQLAVARVDVLAEQLGCTRLEAMQEKRQAAIALVPFIHQKQPLAVNLTNKTVVYLNIVEGEPLVPREDDLTLTAHVVEKMADGND